MMAAEIRDSTIVEAAAISDSNAPVKIIDQPNDVESSTPSLKGTASSGSPDELPNKHIADIVDDLVNSAEPSISGGSDTEASRLDALRNRNGDKGHVRASSAARKPAVFKAVSVNKTFLAAKATASGASKPGEKASPTLGAATLSSSSSASARPRLIAKTGGGLVAKGSGGANGRPAAAPDANGVWNKNRPAPVPEPTKLTDEELKKYGIHVASRLQQDDAKGEANWADIDDDDDDWAPEEIRWTDGTKSTIPHHEEHSLASPQPAVSQLAVQPHAHAQPAVQPRPQPHLQPVPVSLLAKESLPVEKPKSPTPASDLPLSRPSGLPSGKGLVLKGAPERPTLVAKPPAPPSPVKSPWAALPPIDKASPVVMELPHGASAARFQHHQQHQAYQPRENYGPPPSATTPPPFKEIAADDFSRGGFRDGHPHGNRELFNSQSGRLEPVQDRRGGVRGDMHFRQPSGTTLLQRPSQMSDQPEPSAAFQTHRSSVQDANPYGRRRGSSNVSGGSGGFLQRLGRPGDQHALPEMINARQPSVTGDSDSPASPRNFSPSGPRSWQSRPSPNLAFAAPYSNAPTEASPTVQGPPQPPPGSIEDELEMQKKIMRERRELAKKRRLEEEEREEAARRERIRLKLEALGPAPERKSAKKEAPKEDASPSAVSVSPATGTAAEAKPNTSRDAAPDNPQSAHPAPDGNAPSSGPKRQQQSWQSPAAPQSDRLSSWGSAGQAPSRNLWAAPSSNRSLGNGTSFVTEPYAPAVSQIASKQGPGPIGPPASQKSAAPPAIAPIGPPKAASSAAASSTTAAAAAAAPQPAAPPSSASSARSAWTSAVKAGDEDLLAQQKSRRAEQQRDAEARGMSLNDLRPSIKDTWMPTRLNEEGDRIEDKNKRSVVHRPGNTAAAPVGPSAALPPQQSRPSRFFPPRDARSEDATAGSTTATTEAGQGRHGGRPGSPSPPPPDMDGHPVYDGDAAHPLVSLPRPLIVVRLPPEDRAVAAEAAQPTITRSSQHAHGSSSGSHSASQFSPHSPATKDDSSWQAKFDNLFDRKASSPSKPSANRSTADNPPPRGPAADAAAAPQRRPAVVVQSVPSSARAKLIPEEPIISRPMAEECFERQEMGSLPSVHLPHRAPELAWTPAAAPKPLPRRFLLSPTTRVDHDTFLKDSFGAPYAVSIRMPGVLGTAKEVRLPMPRTQSNPRRSNHGRSGRTSRGTNRGRDTVSPHPGSHGNDQSQPANPNHGPPVGRSRGGGGGLRHRSENWTRNSPAPVQT